MRRAGRRDGSEKAICAALEAAGASVFKSLPVDLLIHFRGTWRLMEVKTPQRNRGRVMQERQRKQREFCADYAVPIVEDAVSALTSIGAIGQ